MSTCPHTSFRQLWPEVDGDILRYLRKSPANVRAGDRWKTRISALLTPQLLCLILHRVAHLLWANHWRRLAVSLAFFNFYTHKVMLAPASCIGAGCFLPHPVGTTFCGHAGSGLTLYSLAFCGPETSGLGAVPEASPVLGDNVLVGAHSVVLGRVRVGDGAKLGFHSRVTRDVPAGGILLARTALARKSVTKGTPEK